MPKARFADLDRVYKFGRKPEMLSLPNATEKFSLVVVWSSNEIY